MKWYNLLYIVLINIMVFSSYGMDRPEDLSQSIIGSPIPYKKKGLEGSTLVEQKPRQLTTLINPKKSQKKRIALNKIRNSVKTQLINFKDLVTKKETDWNSVINSIENILSTLDKYPLSLSNEKKQLLKNLYKEFKTIKPKETQENIVIQSGQIMSQHRKDLAIWLKQDIKIKRALNSTQTKISHSEINKTINQYNTTALNTPLLLTPESLSQTITTLEKYLPIKQDYDASQVITKTSSLYKKIINTLESAVTKLNEITKIPQQNSNIVIEINHFKSLASEMEKLNYLLSTDPQNNTIKKIIGSYKNRIQNDTDILIKQIKDNQGSFTEINTPSIQKKMIDHYFQEIF